MTKRVSNKTDYASLAQVLRDLAKAVSLAPPASVAERDNLRDAAKTLYLALADDAGGTAEKDNDELTPEEEVQLLHILE